MPRAPGSGCRRGVRRLAAGNTNEWWSPTSRVEERRSRNRPPVQSRSTSAGRTTAISRGSGQSCARTGFANGGFGALATAAACHHVCAVEQPSVPRAGSTTTELRAEIELEVSSRCRHRRTRSLDARGGPLREVAALVVERERAFDPQAHAVVESKIANVSSCRSRWTQRAGEAALKRSAPTPSTATRPRRDRRRLDARLSEHAIASNISRESLERRLRRIGAGIAGVLGEVTPRGGSGPNASRMVVQGRASHHWGCAPVLRTAVCSRGECIRSAPSPGWVAQPQHDRGGARARIRTPAFFEPPRTGSAPPRRSRARSRCRRRATTRARLPVHVKAREAYVSVAAIRSLARPRISRSGHRGRWLRDAASACSRWRAR